jgi:hypothetical protein
MTFVITGFFIVSVFIVTGTYCIAKKSFVDFCEMMESGIYPSTNF